MRFDIKENISNNLSWYVVTVVILVAVILLGYFALTIEGEKPSRLKVDEVYFGTQDKLGGEYTDLKISLLLTNDEDGDIDQVRVRAFAIETDSNLARDEDTISMGRIPGQTTSEGELNISVPNNESYRIEILVFEESKLTLKGSGTIDLTGVEKASEYESTGGGAAHPSFDSAEDESGGISFGDSDTAPVAICMFMVLGIIIVVVVVGIIIGVTRKEHVPEKIDETERPPERREKAKPLDDFPSGEESDKRRRNE